MKKVLFGCVLALVFSAASADIIDELAADPDVWGAQISPKGDYLAAMKVVDDKNTVVIFKFPSMELSGVMSFPGRNEVGSFDWVNDERIVATILRKYERLEAEVGAGELFAMNADGSKPKHLFGYRAGDTGAKGHIRRSTNEYASASVRNALWHDPKNILIQITNWSAGYSNAVETAMLDVYTGRVRNRVRGPVENAFLVTDAKGEVRFAYSVDDDYNTVIHLRDPDKREWQEFARIPYGETGVEPQLMTEEGKLIVTMQPEGKPRGIYEFDPVTKESREIYQHDIVDLLPEADYQNRMYGTYVEHGVPEFVALDAKHPHARLTRAMKKAFPERVPYVTSSTHDYQKSIVGLSSASHTTEYYLHDRATGQVQLLFDIKPQIDDAKLPTMQPITVTARDGLELHGYLSLPPGADGKNMPMVLVPHGGPHGPRDVWGLGWEAFIPASGYAMLQINFRGSGGYGTAFEKAGHGEWPGKMQDDLTDSVRWAIDQGIADPERICIFGWSYGGYAAGMSIAREPDLYKCSAAGAGALDLEEQYRNSDFAEDTRWGHKYLDTVIGKTKEERMAASPIAHIDKVKTPVLLIHGEEDDRVTVENSRAYVKAMKAAGKPVYKYVELDNEPHSPSNPENWALAHREVIEFVRAHIGPGEFGP